MSTSLSLANQQRSAPIDGKLLRQILEALLRDVLRWESFDLAVHLVNIARITHINETHLRHDGSTDVITFDYRDPERPTSISGEILVCVPVAQEQATQFGTTWQQEVLRYIIHGLLHLSGFDDHTPKQRKRMRAEENRLLAALRRRFPLDRIGPSSARRKRS